MWSDDGCCARRIGKRGEVEDEFVGAGTSSQSVRTKTAVDDVIADAATQDIAPGPPAILLAKLLPRPVKLVDPV